MIDQSAARDTAGITRTRLSMLWVFVSLNYVYGDVFTLLGKGYVIAFTPESLLGAAILVETPIVMVLLSRALKYKANRWANILVGVVNCVATLGSLVAGPPTYYNVFFAAMEIVGIALIIWYAWKWPRPQERST
jgi:hypothetical protein